MPDDGPAQAAGLFACADDCSGATFVALTAGSSWPVSEIRERRLCLPMIDLFIWLDQPSLGSGSRGS